MQRAYNFISHQRHGDVFCVHFQHSMVAESEVDELGAELGRLIDEDNCRKMIVDLSSSGPDLLYSLFLAKLIGLHRRLDDLGGGLALAHLSDDARTLLRDARMEKFFRLYPDQLSALQALNPDE